MSRGRVYCVVGGVLGVALMSVLEFGRLVGANLFYIIFCIHSGRCFG